MTAARKSLYSVPVRKFTPTIPAHVEVERNINSAADVRNNDNYIVSFNVKNAPRGAFFALSYGTKGLLGCD